MTLATTPATGLPTTLGKVQTMRDMLQARLAAFRDVIPRHLSAHRLVRAPGSAASRQPLLLQCTPANFLRASCWRHSWGSSRTDHGSRLPDPYRAARPGQYEAQFRSAIVAWWTWRGAADQIVSIEARRHANETSRGVRPGDGVEREPLLSGTAARSSRCTPWPTSRTAACRRK